MIEALYAFLLKLGYPHPIHAPIAHMPIGMVAGAFTLLVVALIFRRRKMILSARHVFILAFLFVFPTVLFGVFDWVHFYNAVLFNQIKMKMILAAFLFVVLAAGIVLGGEGKGRSPIMLGIYALAFLAVVGLGYYGGDIVFGGQTVSQTGPQEVETPAAAETTGAPRAAVDAGAAVFTANCQSCHAKGGNIVDPQLPLKASKYLQSPDGFIAYIREPKMPDGSGGAMPAFSKDMIGDEQAKQLYDYVVSMRGSPAWK